MIVGLILKKRGSFSQTDSPPNTTTRIRVAICMGDSLPVSRQRTSVASAKAGMKTSVAKTSGV